MATGYNNRIYKGVDQEYVTYQHNLFANKSNKNHYFTKYSTYNRSISTNDHQNSKANCLVNN